MFGFQQSPWEFNQRTCMSNTSPISRGGSRIPGRRGRRPWGAPTYNFVKFSQKLHEIEKSLGRRRRPPPFRSATAIEVLWFSLLCKSVHRFFITEKLYILQNCKTRINFIFDYTEIVWNVFSRLFTQNLIMRIVLVWNCYIVHWIDLFLWISSFQLCLETEAGRAGVTLMKYRLQTKLLECNVFTGVCPFTGGRVHHRIPHPPSRQDIRPGHLLLLWLLTSGGHLWRPVQTCLLEDPTPRTDI